MIRPATQWQPTHLVLFIWVPPVPQASQRVPQRCVAHCFAATRWADLCSARKSLHLVNH